MVSHWKFDKLTEEPSYERLIDKKDPERPHHDLGDYSRFGFACPSSLCRLRYIFDFISTAIHRGLLEEDDRSDYIPVFKLYQVDPEIQV